MRNPYRITKNLHHEAIAHHAYELARMDAIRAVDGIKARFISTTKEGRAAIDTCADISAALKSEE